MYNIELIKSEITDLITTRLRKRKEGTLAEDEEKAYELGIAHNFELLADAYREAGFVSR